MTPDSDETMAIPNKTVALGDVGHTAALKASPRFAANLAWNLLGQGIPLLAALACIPPLIRMLGELRFGVLALAWSLVGYFSLFDLGLGRALTQAVSSRLHNADRSTLSDLSWAALAAMAILGMVSGLALWVTAPWITNTLLKDAPTTLRDEALSACHILAWTIPVVVVTSGLRGLLEALSRFDLANAVRGPMGLLTFSAPLVGAYSGRSVLFSAVGALALVRVAAFTAYGILCLWVVPFLHTRPRIRPRVLRPLFQRGAWITVSNLISPLMTNLDRFVVASVVGVGAVAYYATPFEVVSKLLIIPAALFGVLFPAFAASASDPRREALTVSRATRALLTVLLPVCLVLVAFGPEALRFWMGSAFAQSAAPVLRWLTVGVLFNGLAYVPACFLQATRRPDLSTKFHLLELPLYILVAIILGREFGATGIAAAWAGRAIVDAALLFFATRRELGHSPFPLTGALGGLFALGAFASVAAPTALAVRAMCLVLALSSLSFAAARFLAHPEERTLAKEWLRQHNPLRRPS